MPVDAKYTVAKLNTAIAAAETANADVDTKRIPHSDSTADRSALVNAIGPLVTRSLAFVKSNTAWVNRFDGAKASVKGQYGQSSVQYKSISSMSW